ncbi:c-type cytochrome [Microbulbifer agarilyticus]|uniref:c-type cytochrome n=1 Tax=Microbulbifer agarilyticus TaxID=260552 RepID=UPI001CD1D427|nr:c-type cytochrome [Microbulbifer agarilyticus]MCA0899543.1 c-type cytochrome [Microbulbifer agarilyticus]
MFIKNQIILSFLLLIPELSFAESSIDIGERIFKSKCSACHSLKQGDHMMGPSLHGVVGRQAGTTGDFDFSLAMEQSNIIWSDRTLNQFMENPMDLISGTTMPFGGIRNSADRSSLVDFLSFRSKRDRTDK